MTNFYAQETQKTLFFVCEVVLLVWAFSPSMLMDLMSLTLRAVTPLPVFSVTHSILGSNRTGCGTKLG